MSATAAQRLRTSGFRASLAARGVTLELEPDAELTVEALVEVMPPVVPEYGREIQQSEGVRIHVLREDLGGLTVATGSYWSGSSARYRVQSVEDNPVNVAVVYNARQLPAAAVPQSE